MKNKTRGSLGYTRSRLDLFICVALLLTVISVVYAFMNSGSYSNPISSLTEVWIGATTVYAGLQAWKARCDNKSERFYEFADAVAEKYKDLEPEKLDRVIQILDAVTRE